MGTDIPPRHHCDVCLRPFSRLEHLQRHTKTHVGSKPFACRICPRVFSRKDAVRRHEQTRHDSEGTGQMLPKLRRACAACSSARVSCSGGVPCATCHSRQQPCVYLRRKRRQCSSHEHAALSTSLPESGTLGEPSLRNGSNSMACSDRGEEAAQAQADVHTVRKEATQPNLDLAGSSPTGQDVETALNWLPFDPAVANPPPLDSLSPESNILHEINSAAIVPLTENVLSDCATGGCAPEGDSLASLIASMGRASQPFDRSSSRSILGIGHSTNLAGFRYSDGTGGRISQPERIRRAQPDSTVLAKSLNSVHTSDSECPWLRALEENVHVTYLLDHSQRYCIPDAIYTDVKEKVDERFPFCSTNPTLFLNSRSFPAKKTLEVFIRLYFDHFHPVYPLLDLPLLNMPICGWSLCLATAALGCRYSDLLHKDICADALSVVLRETLVYELQFGHAEFTLSYAQALLLNTLCLCQSGDTIVMALGEEAISPVMSWCRRSCLFQEPEFNTEQSVYVMGDASQMWTAWRCREMRRRTGFFAWLLDIALSLTRYAPSVLNLQSLDLLVPSDEMLWEADSALAWHQAYRPRQVEPPDASDFTTEENGRTSFAQAVSALYQDLKLVDGLSQFACTACIYALFHRHWDMLRSCEGPFVSPNRERGPMLTPYPAAIPAYTSWRNKACDIMDILHWEALGISAKACGLEGPIFLQLHLGRLVLLTPVKELLTLAEFSVPKQLFIQLPHNVAWHRGHFKRSKHVVLTWAQGDRYKARLAVVHAGATLWHVRRYATNALVQPFTIYLAAIVLYFYARVSMDEPTNFEVPDSSTNRSYERHGELRPNRTWEGTSIDLTEAIPPRTCQMPSRNGKQPSPSHGSAYMPTHICIDRPVDDELVQHFVRNDGKPTISCAEGMGDLCTIGGAKQVLLETAMLLDTGNVVWPIARKYAATLRAIAAETVDEVAM